MRWMLPFVVSLALSASAENLLRNAGFEVVSGGAPSDWSVFVQPQQGASSFLDQRVAQSGSNSVKLSIEKPYIDDPANNWSQNILEDMRGKRLHLTGYIKTDNASEAAIWVQCYSKNPLKLASQESTSAKGLLTGTNDWTPVELSIDVPLTTDFVVVRCVLRFRGTAWFDALTLEAGEGAVAPAPASAPDLKMPVPPSMPAFPGVAPPAGEKAVDPHEIIQAHEELRKTNWQLRQSNAAMSKQLEELRKQIDDLKRQMLETAAAAKQLQNEQSKPIERENPVEVPPPPLIPDDTTP